MKITEVLSGNDIVPAWDDIPALTGREVFFRSKENQRGDYLYQKLIKNSSYTVEFESGEIVNGLKPSGVWLHEDDFGARWVCKKKRTQKIAVVELDGPLISRVLAVFDSK